MKIFDFFKRKQKVEFIPENITILGLIYSRFNLIHTEGEFNPITWKRSGDLLMPYEKTNDSIITNFGGLSIIFDIVTKIYSLSIPVKYSSAFCNNVLQLIKEFYDVLEYIPSDFLRNRYTTTIKFK
jgi:hypothetical protein